MPFSGYRPDLMGSACVTPSGKFEAGSMQSFALVYTAGTFGIDDTGSIKIGFRFATDFGPVQFTDPKGQGYTTVAASNGATLGAEYRGRARTTTWDGSLAITGNRILKAAVVNNWNLDRGIQQQSETTLAWKAVTTGNYGAIDLWLETSNAGTLAFKTALMSGHSAVTDIGAETRIFEAGGLERAIKLQRLPDVMTERHLRLQRTTKIRQRGDTRLFVRVQQEDGHRLWSSPIYIFRG